MEFPGLFQDLRDYFQNLTSEFVETQYEYKIWGLWDEFKVLLKIGLFFGNSRGFFKISGIISRTWHQNWLKLKTNIKNVWSLRCFLKLGSFLGVFRAFLRFLGLFPETEIRIGLNSVRIQNVRFLSWILGRLFFVRFFF